MSENSGVWKLAIARRLTSKRKLHLRKKIQIRVLRRREGKMEKTTKEKKGEETSYLKLSSSPSLSYSTFIDFLPPMQFQLNACGPLFLSYKLPNVRYLYEFTFFSTPSRATTRYVRCFFLYRYFQFVRVNITYSRRSFFFLFLLNIIYRFSYEYLVDISGCYNLSSYWSAVIKCQL